MVEDPLVGKRLGKIVILEVTKFPDDHPKRRKYSQAVLVRCDCGVEKLMPKTGITGCRSCGCSRYDYHKVTANETIKHFPNKDLVPSLREQKYNDIPL